MWRIVSVFLNLLFEIFSTIIGTLISIYTSRL